MKNLTRTTAWLLVSVLSVSAAAVHASDWDYKGYGGWRTDDGYGGWKQADEGYARYNTGFDPCQQICKDDYNCKGIEYVSSPSGWQENGQYVHNKCEIHYDNFKHCDTSGGGHGSAQDGCWVIPSRYDEHEPIYNGGRDPYTHQCYAWNWNWISFGNSGKSDVSPDVHDYYKLKSLDYPSSNFVFEVTTHDDCTISLKSRENFKYVSNWDNNHYQLRADGNSIGDEDRYKIYKHSDGTYSFKSYKYHSWVFSDTYSHELSTNPQTVSHWDARKYYITIHDYKH